MKDGVECYPTGMFVEKVNFSGIIDAIRELYAHPLSAGECRKRAEICFDEDKCFEKYIRLYESLI